MENYTGKDETTMMRRYLDGSWTNDTIELKSFIEALQGADTTARETADMVESNMAKYFIEHDKYECLDPYWLVEYQGILQREFTRGQLLKVMQFLQKRQTQEGYHYVEEINLMRTLWDCYK